MLQGRPDHIHRRAQPRQSRLTFFARASPPIYRCSLPLLWSVAVLKGPWLIHSAGPPSGPLALLFSPESSTLMHRFPPITGLYPPRSPDRKVLDHATTPPRLLARAAGSQPSQLQLQRSPAASPS